MGLLTDPSGGQGKFTKALIKYHSKLCILLYLAGVVWFCVLAYPPMNGSTYFSENALLPGLVKSQFHEDRLAIRYYEELLDEMKKYDDSIPYPWLTAKFRQIGVDTYTHNFTLNSPLNAKEKYSGKNVYGILRAARASSTEALVLSVPYRPPASAHPSTAASIAVILAFAKYANKEKYWAKDIIFLVTEHEQLGVQAWLEAYHGVSCGNENTLDHGDLRGRAGAIQAAINLEFHTPHIGHIDIKIEGLNGQLPNLDLFNLAAKMCVKEGVYYTFKNKHPEYHRDPFKEWLYHFKRLMLMVATQATGIPNGNHGLFHRFGIQALTLEGFEKSRAAGSIRVSFTSIGRILEGTFRSMNNLLERFHQSYFFYLLPSSDRYISIGLYMPAVCLIAGALIIRACAKWCKIQENSLINIQLEKDKQNKERSLDQRVSYIRIVLVFILMHVYGILLMTLPSYIPSLIGAYNFYDATPSAYIFYTLSGLSALALLIPFSLFKMRSCEGTMNMLNIFTLLELGTALVCISMNNFSLGIICAAISVPFALFITPTSCKYCAILQKLLWLTVHPLIVIFAIVSYNTYSLVPEENLKSIFFKSLDATQNAVVYSIVDSMIYGNWLFTVVTSIFIPNWLCFWCITFSSIATPKISDDKKTN